MNWGRRQIIYDAISDRVVLREASGHARLWVGPNASLVAVLVPPNAKCRRAAARTTIDDVTVRYAGSG